MSSIFVAFRIILNNALAAVVRRINRNHREGDSPRTHKPFTITVIKVFNFLVVHRDLGIVLVLKLLDGNIFARFFAQRLHSQILSGQVLSEIVISHPALRLLVVNNCRNLIFGGQQFFTVRALKKHFPLDQGTEHLQSRLGQFELRKLRLLAAGLLTHASLDLSQ